MNLSSVRLFARRHVYAILLFISGAVGLLASLILTLDKIEILKNPDFIPACSINPVLTCTSAMSSVQSETFGIPNSIIGIILFTALLVVSGLLFFGVKYSKPILASMLVASIAGFIFTTYLILQSVLVLHIICPWCFTVWIVSPIILFATYRLYRKMVATGKSSRTLIFLDRHSGFLLAVWYALLLILLVFAFREYIITLIPT